MITEDQEQLIQSQADVVDGARTIFTALAGEPSAELISYLVEKERLATARRLSSQTSYLFRLKAGPIPVEELHKSMRVQQRLLSEQAQALTALGLPLEAPVDA